MAITPDVPGMQELDLVPPAGDMDTLLLGIRHLDHLNDRIKMMIATILHHQADLSRPQTGLLELHFGGDSVRGKLRLDLPAVPGAGRERGASTAVDPGADPAGRQGPARPR